MAASLMDSRFLLESFIRANISKHYDEEAGKFIIQPSLDKMVRNARVEEFIQTNEQFMEYVLMDQIGFLMRHDVANEANTHEHVSD